MPDRFPYPDPAISLNGALAILRRFYLLPVLLLLGPGLGPAGLRPVAAQVRPAAASEAGIRTVRAVRVRRGPVLDGRLSDEVWSSAGRTGGFTQREPDGGAPATEGTDFRALYTPTDLFFAVRCFDSRPGELRIMQMRRDGDLTGDDRIEIILDTFGDHRTAYAFSFNPAGARWDAEVREEGRNLNLAWDGVWWVSTRIEEWGWSAEVRIPFATLRFAPGAEQVWGLNVQRVLRRRNEDTFWMPVERGLGSGPEADGKYRPAYAGRLEGLQGIHPASRLEFKPYLMSSNVKRFGEGTAERADFGADISCALTSGLTADLTINTDFAQVEADQEQINLDRFPLYYPERREFFREGLDIFTFGITEQNAPPPFQLFDTRRIGLSPSRYEVPLTAGLKVTGKAGSYALGALVTRTEEFTAPAVPTGAGGAADHASAAFQGVFRISRDVLERSRIGVMALGTDHGLFGTGYTAVGADAHFSLFRNTQLSGFLAGSRQGAGELAPAGALSVDWNTDRWGVGVSNLYLDPDYSDDLGFVRRTGVWRNAVNLSWKPRPRIGGIRQAIVFTDAVYHTRPAGRLESRLVDPGLIVLLQNGGSVTAGVNGRYEFVETAFGLGEVTVGEGVYSWAEGFLNLSTDPSRPLSTSTTVIGGDYYHARRLSLWSTVRWRPSRFFTNEAIVSTNRIIDDTDRFTGEVWAGRFIWTPTTTLLAKLFGQVNTAAQVANLNLLVSFEFRPRSYIYLVFNNDFYKLLGSWKDRDKALFLKVSLFQSG